MYTRVKKVLKIYTSERDVENRREKDSECVVKDSRTLWSWWARIKSSGWGVEVRGRDTSRGGGCIDCVRLVRREEIRQDRERTIGE